MYSSRVTPHKIVKNVISSGGDAKHSIVRANPKNLLVYPWIFPIEGVDIFCPELSVFGEVFFIVDAGRTVLIECRRKREICSHVDHGRLTGFGLQLGCEIAMTHPVKAMLAR